MYVTTHGVSNGSDTLWRETNHCFRGRKRLPSCELRDPLQLPCIVQERCSCSHRQIASHLIALEQGSDVPIGTANTPLYTMPELSLTVTGAPMISLRNPLGSLELPAASGPGLSPLVDMMTGVAIGWDWRKWKMRQLRVLNSYIENVYWLGC